MNFRYLTFLGVLLALLAVISAKKYVDQIRLYDFTGDYCTGHPNGANIDLAKDVCSNDVHGQSIKAIYDDQHTKWLDEINLKSWVYCHLVLYKEPGCLQEHALDFLPVPDVFQQCYTGKDLIKSTKWYCGEKPEGISVIKTSITVSTLDTSWSIKDNGIATPIVTTKSAVLPTSVVVSTPVNDPSRKTKLCADCLLPPHKRSTPEDDIDDVADAIEPGEMSLNAPQVDENSHYVYLLHPWAGSALCYHCYTKKPGDFRKVECRSGKGHEVLCQPPAKSFIATTTESVLMMGQTFTFTTTRAPLEARGSWHKRVSFKHPFFEGRVCADAEWEKRGKKNTEIRLQKLKRFTDPKDCEGGMSLDLAGPLAVGGVTTKTVSRYTQFATVTETAWSPHKDL